MADANFESRCGEKRTAVADLEVTASVVKVAKSENMPAIESTTHPHDIDAMDCNLKTVLLSNSNKAAPVLSAGGKCYLQTLLVRLIGAQGQSEMVRIMLDNCSHRTLVRRSIVEKLNLSTVHKQSNRIEGVGGNVLSLSGASTMLTVQSLDSKSTGQVFAELTDTICSPLVNVPSEWLRSMLKKEGIELTDCNNFETAVSTLITALFGAGVVERLTLSRLKLTDKLSAIHTLFGWCVIGGEEEKQISLCSTNKAETVDQSIDLSRFWAAEGWSDPTNEEAAAQAIEDARRNLKLVNSRYYTNLVWIDKSNLRNNFAVARSRIQRWVDQLRTDQKYEQYETELWNLVKEGFAEVVDVADYENGYFVPHRGVWKESSETTKLRIVFDCSSHAKGDSSLNDKLSKGVDLNPLIHDLLLKFRIGRYGIVADLKQAFLQIRLNKNERKYTQFLWIDRNNRLQVLRMTSVLFGATCSPFLLAIVLKHHLEVYANTYPIATALKNRFYVDDLILTANRIQDLTVIKEQAEQLFKECSMTLHKWRCSDVSLDSKWATKGKSPLKVLGIFWDVKQDMLSANLKPILVPNLVTLRTVLKQVGSLFDPLGLASPVVLPFKLLAQQVQQLNKNKLDAPASKKQTGQLKRAIESLKNAAGLSFPRCVGASGRDLCLGVFCDASKVALGAVAYAVDYHQKEPKITLMGSKSTLIPTNKRRSMPETELQAAVIGTRLMNKVKEATGITHFKMFSDATAVLGWMRKDANQLEIYVRNRLNTILQSTNPNQWSHVPGLQNPADLVSRGCTTEELVCNTGWRTGPPELAKLKRDDFTEYKNDFIGLITKRSSKIKRKDDPTLSVDCWDTLLKKAQVVLQIEKAGNCSRHAAWFKLVRCIQKESFGEELLAVKSNRPLPKSSRLANLKVIIDCNGLLRSKARYDNFSDEFNHPLILDGRHRWIYFWVKHQHRSTYHLKEKNLMDLIKETSEVVDLRSVVRRVISDCQECVIERAKGGSGPAGPLPRFRTTPSTAFTNIGIDCFGPISVRKKGGIIGKKYGLLITWAVTRGVGIELLPGLSSTDIWKALNRLFNRFGRPSLIYSDNATSFHRVAKDFKKLFTALQNARDCEDANTLIEWRFSAPAAPHQGGFFERMIQTVKSHLKKLTDHHLLNEYDLASAISDVEAIVNSRPIGIMPDGSLLSPSHFLIGRKLIGMPTVGNLQIEGASSSLKAYVCRQRMTSAFWRAWKRSYLTSISDRFFKPGKSTILTKGMRVLLHDDTAKRCDWSVGIIEKEVPSRDGHCRVFQVKVNGKLMTRALQRLSPLELSLGPEDVRSSIEDLTRIRLVEDK